MSSLRRGFRRFFVCRQAALAVSVAVFALAGCGDGRTKMSIAPAEGTVICEGQPVPFVSVFFVPERTGNNAVVGKGAVGYCDDKGHFVLSTYDTNDGAVVGKHQVCVGPPMGDPHPGFQCSCGLNAEKPVTSVDVVSGQPNKFEIALKVASKREKAEEAKAAAKAKTDQ